MSSSQSDLVFSLQTEGIEAKALSKILYDTHLAFREICKDIGEGEPELRILPFKEGSFEYLLAVGGIIGFGKLAVDTFKSCIDLKKSKLDYKRQKLFDEPKKEATISQDNPVVNKLVSDILKTISEHSEGLILKDRSGKKVHIEINKHQIQKVLKIESEEQKVQKDKVRDVEKRVELVLVKTHTSPFGMWTFFYDGIRIMADLGSVYKEQNKGMRPGTILSATLKIWQVYNPDAKSWENKRYRVVDIHGLV